MSKVKITALTELSTPDNADFLAIVDTDEPQLDLQTKKITVANLTAGLDLSLPLNNKGDLLSSNGATVVGVPISTTNGYVLTVNDSQPAGFEWAPATGAGNPFLFVNSVIAALNANLPDVTGTDSIGLGADVTVDGGNSVGVGLEATASGENSISIGYQAVASEDGAIVLGTRTDGAATIASGIKSIAIGASASTAATAGIVIGSDTFVAGPGGIAIGDGAISGDAGASLPNGNGAIALGDSANASAFNSIAIGNSASAGFTSIAIGASQPASNSTVAIGDSTVIGTGCTYAIAIGTTAQVSNDAAGGIAIGYNSAVDPNATDAVVIGRNASSNGANAAAIGQGANADAALAVQLAQGTNSTASTLQYLTNTIADAEGIVAPSAAAAPTSTPADGGLFVDSNADLLYFRSSGSWHKAGRLTNESITSGTELTVTPGVSSDRLFITPTATIDLILDTTGATNTTYFVIVNVDPGGGDINIKIDNNTNPTVLTLNSGTNNVSVAYDGTDYKLWA